MARSFNGTSDRITIGTPAALDLHTVMSLSAWVYYGATGAARGFFYDTNAGFTTNQWGGTTNSSDKLTFDWNNASPRVVGVTALVQNVWTHVAMTRSGVAGNWTGNIYINGVLDKSTSGIAQNPSLAQGGIAIGRWGAASSGFWNGRIAECGLWNVALSAGEVLALARGQLPPWVRPSGMVGYWPVFGLESPEPDYSGSKSNGTLTGTALIGHAPVTYFTPQALTPPDLVAAVIPGGGGLLVPSAPGTPPYRGSPFLQRLTHIEDANLAIQAPAPGIIQVVQQTPGAKTVIAGTSLTDWFPAPVHQNAGLVAIIASASAPSSVTDSIGNTYIQACSSSFFGADNCSIWYTITNPGGANVSVTANYAGNTGSNLVVVELTDNILLDVIQTASGAGGTPRTGFVRTTKIVEIVFAILNNGHNTPQAAPYGFTNLFDDITVEGSEASYQSLQAIQGLDALWVGASAPAAVALATFSSTGKAGAAPSLASSPEVRQGPPIRGAPWTQRLRIEAANLVIQAPIPPVAPSPSFPNFEITAGPPIRGAPFTQRLPQTEAGNLVIQAPPVVAASPSFPQSEIRQGPPIRGAPWVQKLATEEANLVIQAAPVVVVAAPIYAPEIREGPFMRGAPWLKRIAHEEDLGAPPAPLVPVTSAPSVPEIHSGPPIRGAPWLARLPVVPPPAGPRFPMPPPIPVGPGRGKARPLLNRLPDTDDDRRLSRVADQLSSIVNSLVGQGILQQVGPMQWTLRTGGFVMPRPPTANDDVLTGVNPGVVWIDTMAGKAYINISNAHGAAIWSGPF